MNRSVADVGGEVLISVAVHSAGRLSQGRRPSLDHSGRARLARALYERGASLRESGLPVATGVFQAHWTSSWSTTDR